MKTDPQTTSAATTLVVEDDQLEAAYDAQFVPVYKAARAVKKRFLYVQKLCLTNQVTHRRLGRNPIRILVHLTELRRVIREREIHRPKGATSDEAPRRAHAATLNPAALKMLDPKRKRQARKAG